MWSVLYAEAMECMSSAESVWYVGVSSTVVEKGHSILPISVFPILTIPISVFPIWTFPIWTFPLLILTLFSRMHIAVYT